LHVFGALAFGAAPRIVEFRAGAQKPILQVRLLGSQPVPLGAYGGKLPGFNLTR
jgi:hypothetical protein